MYNTHSEMRLFVHYYVGIFVVVVVIIIMCLCLTKPKWHAVTEIIIAFRLCILHIFNLFDWMPKRQHQRNLNFIYPIKLISSSIGRFACSDYLTLSPFSIIIFFIAFFFHIHFTWKSFKTPAKWKRPRISFLNNFKWNSLVSENIYKREREKKKKREEQRHSFNLKYVCSTKDPNPKSQSMMSFVCVKWHVNIEIWSILISQCDVCCLITCCDAVLVLLLVLLLLLLLPLPLM